MLKLHSCDRVRWAAAELGSFHYNSITQIRHSIQIQTFPRLVHSFCLNFSSSAGDEDVSAYRKVFEKYDLDKDGRIGDRELMKLLKDAGQEPNKQNLNREYRTLLSVIFCWRSTSIHASPSSRRTLLLFKSLKIRRSANFMQFRNVVQRILKL